MGVSVEGGRGRGRNQNVDLNLVPFIDFMSCLIAFLMIAAVWTQVASLDVEQSVGESDIIDGPISDAPPPLTIHLRADGAWIGRKVEEGAQVPKVGDAWDLVALGEHMRADHDTFPAEDMVIINTDDGVPYDAMVQVLDLSRAAGYPRTLLAGGPAAASVQAIAPG